MAERSKAEDSRLLLDCQAVLNSSEGNLARVRIPVLSTIFFFIFSLYFYLLNYVPPISFHTQFTGFDKRTN